MSDQIKVLLPKLGESIQSATVVQWFKKIGDKVRLDEPLLEVSTDKVNSEIPSPSSGVLLEIHASPDEELQVGALLAVIGSVKNATLESPSTSVTAQVSSPSSGTEEMKGFFSPAFLRIARENGIDLAEMQKIPGTGMGGRVTKSDLEEYIAKKGKSSEPCPLAEKKTVVSGTEIERLKMSGMRKAIADNMVRSFYEAPHATLVAEVDVTAALKWIQKEKEAFACQYGCKVTSFPNIDATNRQRLHGFSNMAAVAVDPVFAPQTLDYRPM